MTWFFPDALSRVNLNYDLQACKPSGPADFRYAHELLTPAPYTGIVVSKSLVDPLPQAQQNVWPANRREQLYEQGVQDFFRLRAPGQPRVLAIGNCGSFVYGQQEYPPYTSEQAAEFYESCGFDAGMAVDHMIYGCNHGLDDDPNKSPPEDWVFRQKMGLYLAEEFMRLHRKQRYRFAPMAVAHGWSPLAYADAVTELERIGYKHVGLGSIANLKSGQIGQILDCVSSVKNPTTKLHLLQLSPSRGWQRLLRYTPISFESNTPFYQAHLPIKKQYHFASQSYTAIHLPSVDTNPILQDRIKSGNVDARKLRDSEAECYRRLRAWDKTGNVVGPVLSSLKNYSILRGDQQTFKSLLPVYKKTLAERPWKRCGCCVCEISGIDVVLIRSAEHACRRGFHNMAMFKRRLANIGI